MLHLRRFRDLDFLGHCIMDRANCLQLPSWVPDWSDMSPVPPWNKNARMWDAHSEPLYRASGMHLKDLANPVESWYSPRVLKLSGIQIASIAHKYKKVLEKPSNLTIDVETPWGSARDQGFCPLNDVSIEEIFETTIVLDTRIVVQGYVSWETRTYQRGGRYSRGERVRYLTPLERSLSPKYMHNNLWCRRLFETKPQCNDGQGLIGLGPGQAKPGDEVWMLKGGKVLYILRPKYIREHQILRTLNLVNGECRDEKYSEDDLVYEFIGESFILGLMDGEILDMMGENLERPRPSILYEMDSKFRIISMR
jgi:hypothetical protein